MVDASGNELPAVEYWAGSPEEDQPSFQVVPLRRFVKLLGIGESLREIRTGVFEGLSSGRRFVRSEHADSLTRGADKGLTPRPGHDAARAHWS
ncbi:hypothetical protein [Ramlibacter sp. Leaf400]|uniref:hypothetical protein n=1 Tax=Ramlibacter sp. Leaf400 TaxID=1736365 RepID=UPI0012E35462|nr:hypothetical protein [Ramlibacter sp. Leaf400]